MKLRSLLLVASDSQSSIAKAAMLAADALVLDLLSPGMDKARKEARARVADWIKRKRRRGLMVRISPMRTEYYFADLLAIVPARPAAIVMPRCGGPLDLAALDHHLQAIEAAQGLTVGTTKVLAVIETLAAARDMSYHAPPERLVGLCFGAEGIAAELGITPRDETGTYRAPLKHLRTTLLIAASAAQVAAIDAHFPDPLDRQGLAEEIDSGAQDGFTGKLCIHPSQVAPINEAFTSAPERAEWARQIQRAFAAAPDGEDLMLNGEIIDRNQLRAAERILSAFE